MINIIWQTESSSNPVITNETTNVFEYITKVLFKNVEHINHFDNKEYKTVLDKSIIIYLNEVPDISNKAKNYLERYKSMNYKYILFHLGDEAFHDSYPYYSDANYTFRCHYNPNIISPDVTTLPMGFLTGYMNNEEKINLSKDRNILVTFIGDLKHDRQLLLDNISGIESKFVHTTTRWGDPNQIPFDKVIDIYKKTIFTPIPLGYGNRDECCRPYEALEWGCIPIIKNVNGVDFYKPVIGDHPFPTINEWSEIVPLINKLMADNIDDLIIKVNQWYLAYKERLSKQVYDIVYDKLIK